MAKKRAKFQLKGVSYEDICRVNRWANGYHLDNKEKRLDDHDSMISFLRNERVPYRFRVEFFLWLPITDNEAVDNSIRLKFILNCLKNSRTEKSGVYDPNNHLSIDLFCEKTKGFIDVLDRYSSGDATKEEFEAAKSKCWDLSYKLYREYQHADRKFKEIQEGVLTYGHGMGRDFYEWLSKQDETRGKYQPVQAVDYAFRFDFEKSLNYINMISHSCSHVMFAIEAIQSVINK